MTDSEQLDVYERAYRAAFRSHWPQKEQTKPKMSFADGYWHAVYGEHRSHGFNSQIRAYKDLYVSLPFFSGTGAITDLMRKSLRARGIKA